MNRAAMGSLPTYSQFLPSSQAAAAPVRVPTFAQASATPALTALLGAPQLATAVSNFQPTPAISFMGAPVQLGPAPTLPQKFAGIPPEMAALIEAATAGAEAKRSTVAAKPKSKQMSRVGRSVASEQKIRRDVATAMASNPQNKGLSIRMPVPAEPAAVTPAAARAAANRAAAAASAAAASEQMKARFAAQAAESRAQAAATAQAQLAAQAAAQAKEAQTNYIMSQAYAPGVAMDDMGYAPTLSERISARGVREPDADLLAPPPVMMAPPKRPSAAESKEAKKRAKISADMSAAIPTLADARRTAEAKVSTSGNIVSMLNASTPSELYKFMFDIGTMSKETPVLEVIKAGGKAKAVVDLYKAAAADPAIASWLNDKLQARTAKKVQTTAKRTVTKAIKDKCVAQNVERFNNEMLSKLSTLYGTAQRLYFALPVTIKLPASGAGAPSAAPKKQVRLFFLAVPPLPNRNNSFRVAMAGKLPEGKSDVSSTPARMDYNPVGQMDLKMQTTVSAGTGKAITQLQEAGIEAVVPRGGCDTVFSGSAEMKDSSATNFLASVDVSYDQLLKAVSSATTSSSLDRAIASV
jgi:hypothetical protein